MVEVLASPKSHSHEVMLPCEAVEPSVKSSSGQSPSSDWKAAVAVLPATVTVSQVVWVQPVAEVTVRHAV